MNLHKQNSIIILCVSTYIHETINEYKIILNNKEICFKYKLNIHGGRDFPVYISDLFIMIVNQHI